MEDFSTLPNYEKEARPWGNFERFTQNEPSTVKIITVKPEEALSLQTHAHRDEFWRILSGSGIVTLGNETQDVRPGDEFFIPKGMLHRAQAGKEGLQFLEIAFGIFNEADITQVQDRYGRV